MHFKTIWRNTSLLLVATYSVRAVTALRSFINARWLGPETYGFWGSLALLMSFAYYLHAGLQDVMVRDIPTYHRKNQDRAAAASVNQTLSFFVVMLSFACIGFILKAVSLPPETPVVIRMAWFTAALVMPLEVLWSFEQMVLRAEERFDQISRNLLIIGIVSLILTFWLVRQYALPGLFAVAILTPALGLVLARRKTHFPWRFQWDPALIRSMLKTGWPLLVIAFIIGALGWVDQAIVIRLLGTNQYGYYVFGGLLTQLCLLFPTVVASVIEPRLYSDYAHQQQASDIRAHLGLQLKIIAIAMPLGLGLVNWLAPFIIQHWLPAYLPAISVIRVLIWSSLLSGFILCIRSFIVAINRQQQALPIYLVAIGTNLLLSSFLAIKGFGLIGVALGTVVALALCSTSLLVFAFSSLGEPWPRILRRAALFSVPATVLLLNNYCLAPAFQLVVLGLYALIVALQLKNHLKLKHNPITPKPPAQQPAYAEASA